MVRMRTVPGTAARFLACFLVLGTLLILASCYSFGGAESSAAYEDYADYDDGGYGAVADSPESMPAAERSAAAGPADAGITPVDRLNACGSIQQISTLLLRALRNRGMK